MSPIATSQARICGKAMISAPIAIKISPLMLSLSAIDLTNLSFTSNFFMRLFLMNVLRLTFVVFD